MRAWMLLALALPLTVAAAEYRDRPPEARIDHGAGPVQRAASEPYPDLPPSEQVERALHEHPVVRASEAGLRAEEAQRARLEAGPHEFALIISGQQRRDGLLDTSYHEHEVGIERAIRLPGKAALDAELGAVGVEHAGYLIGDALHESSRLLLRIWFDWQREMAAVQDWQSQVTILQRQRDAVTRRIGTGDAARLEGLLAEAQLVQAEAQLAQAKTRCANAALGLRQDFPAVTLPATTGSPVPLAVTQFDDSWRVRIIDHNHELHVAKLAAQRGRLMARRLKAERIADPTVGLRFSSERGGAEHIVGLQLTIRVGGVARAASARAGAAEADVAAAREAQVRARVEAEAQRTVAAAHSAYAQWQRLADVAQRMDDSADLLEKAWRAGEGQFGDLQVARRQALEARLAESQARLDANEARYRLLLDAHELWPLDRDQHSH